MTRGRAYQVLGLEPFADVGAIRQSFRQRVKECAADPVGVTETTAKVWQLIAAYEALTGLPAKWEFVDRSPGTLKLRYGEWRCYHCEGDVFAGLLSSGRLRRRDARYCDAACRQAAYRARKGHAEGGDTS